MAKPRTVQTSASDHTDVATKKPVRNTRARVRKIKPDDVAVRAYLISLSEPETSPEENWLRAEQELLAS
jgi:hypothetical protein